MQMKLGEQIRQFRHRAGKTQEEVALALGVTAQAISRWEKEICYPDMELIPSIANFFTVSIDELFGYDDERVKRIHALAEKIREMNLRNNGSDVCMDECIQFARESLSEFPENEKIMLCLASALYNAGYVRHGEHHLTDEQGYDVFDVERHRTYPEWREAITLYEKLLLMLDEGEARRQAVRELLQLYVNVGESGKAFRLAQTAPGLSDCRELLCLNTCDGAKRAEQCGESLLTLAKACSSLMISCIQVNKAQITPADAVQIVKNSIDIFGFVCTDGNYGLYHADLIGLNLYLSEFLWLAGDHDGAFEALDQALDHAKRYEAICGHKEVCYTAPLISKVKSRQTENGEVKIAAHLPNDWPWWRVPDCSQAEAEIKTDPRWAKWVKKTQAG